MLNASDEGDPRERREGEKDYDDLLCYGTNGKL